MLSWASETPNHGDHSLRHLDKASFHEEWTMAVASMLTIRRPLGELLKHLAARGGPHTNGIRVSGAGLWPWILL